MRKKIIRVNPYNENSIDMAIFWLEQYKKDIPVKLDKAVLNTRSMGKDVADTLFHTAQYDGDNDVKTQLSAGKTVKVTASGEAVAFIEFGTGIVYGAYGGEIPPEVTGRGQYGKGLGKNQSWFYTGNPGTNGVVMKNGTSVKTEGNPPAERMLNARNRMVEKIVENVRKEFENG